MTGNEFPIHLTGLELDGDDASTGIWLGSRVRSSVGDMRVGGWTMDDRSMRGVVVVTLMVRAMLVMMLGHENLVCEGEQRRAG